MKVSGKSSIHFLQKAGEFFGSSPGLEAQYRAFIDASPMGVIMIDEQGCIMMVNKLAYDLFDYPQGELLGQPIEILIPERFRSIHIQKRSEFLAAPEHRPMGQGRELMGLRKDGSEFPIEVALSPLRTDQGIFVLASMMDITVRKQHEFEMAQYKQLLRQLVDCQTRDLVLAKTTAERANAAKSEFLANMSHELRTPMHSILSYAHLAKKKLVHQDIDKIGHFLDQILASGNRLLLLLNDLLDLSKLESGKNPLNFAEHDVRAIIARLMLEFEPMLRSKGLVFRMEDTMLNTSIQCDSQKLYQVFFNLVSNTIKFSPPSKQIWVRFETTTCILGNRQAEVHEEPALMIQIEDQGIGVPESELTQIFDKFFQGSKTKTGAGGTGLGLAISKEIIECHRGKIWAENAQDEGMIFSMVLPYTQPNTARREKGAKADERADHAITG